MQKLRFSCVVYKKNRPLQTKRTEFCEWFLSSFKTIATGARSRVVCARIPNVNFAKRTIIARTVIFTFRYATADTSVDFLFVFVHHNKKPPFW